MIQFSLHMIQYKVEKSTSSYLIFALKRDNHDADSMMKLTQQMKIVDIPV